MTRMGQSKWLVLMSSLFLYEDSPGLLRRVITVAHLHTHLMTLRWVIIHASNVIYYTKKTHLLDILSGIHLPVMVNIIRTTNIVRTKSCFLKIFLSECVSKFPRVYIAPLLLIEFSIFSVLIPVLFLKTQSLTKKVTIENNFTLSIAKLRIIVVKSSGNTYYLVVVQTPNRVTTNKTFFWVQLSGRK